MHDNQVNNKNMTTKADIFDVTFHALQKNLKYDLLNATSFHSEHNDEMIISSIKRAIINKDST